MSEARFDRVSNENNTAGPIISGITTFSGLNYFVPPKGTTAERPSNCPVGSIRFNTDSAKIEYFNGLQWLEMEAFNVEIGQAGALGNRGLFATGNPSTDTINYITISTTGNALDFGDLTQARRTLNSFSSSTRGVFGGGRGGPSPSFSSVVDYITISSTGNAISFGDTLNSGLRAPFGLSNATRGVFGGGYTPTDLSLMEYTTISSLSLFQNFGNLQTARAYVSGCSSSTRGLISSCGPASERIDYITISTLGNSATFGNLTQSRIDAVALSNATRGVFGGGGLSPLYNIIEYVTISTLGNAIDFGDLSSAKQGVSACESSTRGVFGGGANPANLNTIEYITILSTGNAIDFGDLIPESYEGTGLSNGHGGL